MFLFYLIWAFYLQILNIMLLVSFLMLSLIAKFSFKKLFSFFINKNKISLDLIKTIIITLYDILCIIYLIFSIETNKIKYLYIHYYTFYNIFRTFIFSFDILLQIFLEVFFYKKFIKNCFFNLNNKFE